MPGSLTGAPLLFISLLISTSVQAEEIIGCVVGVSDGDTHTILVSRHNQIKVRLAGVACNGYSYDQLESWPSGPRKCNNAYISIDRLGHSEDYLCAIRGCN